MFTSAAKTLLKNHIRHADTHNRMVEESEMWACHGKLSKIDNHRDTTDKRRTREERTNSRYDKRGQSNPFTGRNDSQASFLYDRRDESESPEDRGGAYMDRQESERTVSRKEWKASQDLKTGIDRWDHGGYEKQNPSRKLRKVKEEERWGHSGYKMMYPGDFDSDTSDDHRKKRKRERSKRKNKKYKKRKKKRKKNKDSEKKAEKEHSDTDQVKTETSDLKNNSDLMLMQRFKREIRPEKPSQPRMKMRTWNSDSSADSDDNGDRKIKSGKYRRRKSEGNRSDESSVDSSYDSDSEGEDRYRKRKKVKTRRKTKRRHESDVLSDSGENYPSSRKRVCSSRTSSSSDSTEEYSGQLMSDKQYSERRYSENSDLTGDSDSNRKRKNDTDIGYSTTKKHKKKKKKHRYK
ncbi:uncharacterized protein NKAPD1-like [Pecten maximus]|uniref:uncharacterized protein NKAPD1-like n=1 Tax=Pecten maximus TaxID=6579 RepID=UPI00145854F9|nr:uncharacterized protein NKAPD1-like [Pecten maximus]XP_033757920.1 uncharacterized protein NKAPD1-like [Pecten maximus]